MQFLKATHSLRNQLRHHFTDHERCRRAKREIRQVLWQNFQLNRRNLVETPDQPIRPINVTGTCQIFHDQIIIWCCQTFLLSLDS